MYFIQNPQINVCQKEMHQAVKQEVIYLMMPDGYMKAQKFLLMATPYYRKYFKMRFESLEKDKVDIEGCKFVQLKMRVQTDGSNWNLLLEGV